MTRYKRTEVHLLVFVKDNNNIVLERIVILMGLVMTGSYEHETVFLEIWFYFFCPDVFVFLII